MARKYLRHHPLRRGPRRFENLLPAVFGLPVHCADDDSVVFRFGDTLVNLLAGRAAPEVIAPAMLAPAGAGASFQFTLSVDDVDDTCAELTRRGAELLNGPTDRLWGIRTVSFIDPDGYIWEISE